MTSSPRGSALLISNLTFHSCAAPELEPRKGGEVDDEVLRKVFTELDYVVTVRRDLTAQVRSHTLSDTPHLPSRQQARATHLTTPIRRAFLPLRVIIQGIKTCIENFSRRPEHQTLDSCVVCLLSHGLEGAIYGVDGQLVQVRPAAGLLILVSGFAASLSDAMFKGVTCG